MTPTDVVDRLTTRFDHLDPAFTPDVAPAVCGRIRETPGLTWTPAHGGMWIVARYASVRAVQRDHETFSSAAGVFHPRAEGAPRFCPIDHDPPSHGPLRRLMTPPLTPAAVRRLGPAVAELVRGLVEPLVRRGGGDLVGGLAEPLAVGVLALAIGLSPQAQGQIREMTATLWRRFSQDGDASAFWPGFRELLSDEVARARRAEDDTYLARLVHTTLDGAPVDEDTLCSIVVSFCIAGHETTMNTASRLLWHLGRHPELQERLRAVPRLRRVAVDETMRRWCPTDRFTRVTTRETALEGTTLPAGSRVMLLVDAANRDPEVFPDPETFSLDRGNSHRHLGFGAGIHACMGAGLARLELTTVLDQLAHHPPFVLTGEPRRHFENGRHVVFDQVPVDFAAPSDTADTVDTARAELRLEAAP